MEPKLAVTIISCIFIISASATNLSDPSSKLKESNQDLKTAESSRFLNYFDGNRGRYPWNPSVSSNGYYGHGYHYPFPNNWHNNQYYPTNGGYPGFQYPNYNTGGPGGYPGGYNGYPGGYSSGITNGYNGIDLKDRTTRTAAQDGYVH